MQNFCFFSHDFVIRSVISAMFFAPDSFAGHLSKVVECFCVSVSSREFEVTSSCLDITLIEEQCPKARLRRRKILFCSSFEVHCCFHAVLREAKPVSVH